jgi:hypothetical protein
MVADGDYVAVFQSIHKVMKAEKILKQKGFPVLLIPAPRALSSDCGLALRYAPEDRLRVEETLAAASLLPQELYLKEGESYKPVNRETGS